MFKKLNLIIFQHIWKMMGFSFVQPAGFPKEFFLIERRGEKRLLMSLFSGVVVTDRFDSVAFDLSGRCFVIKKRNQYSLMSLEGEVVCETRSSELPGGQVISEQFIGPKGDGTYRYLSNNHLAGNGWETVIDNKGEELKEKEHFLGVRNF